MYQYKLIIAIIMLLFTISCKAPKNLATGTLFDMKEQVRIVRSDSARVMIVADSIVVPSSKEDNIRGVTNLQVDSYLYIMPKKLVIKDSKMIDVIFIGVKPVDTKEVVDIILKDK